jgi:hypothetical protein
MYLDTTYNNNDLIAVKLTEPQQNELIGMAIKKRRTWLQMTQDYRDKALEVRQLYLENRPKAQSYTEPDVASESRSNVRMPLMAQAVDSTLAQQHTGTFPTDEKFYKVHAKNDLTEAKQLLYEDATEKRLQDINFMHKAKMDRMNAMLDGVSCVWHPYLQKKRRKAVYTPKTFLGISLGQPTKTYEEQVYLEATDYIPLNLEDWWLDPTVDDFDNTNFIWRQWVDVEYLKTIKEFKNTKDVKTLKSYMDEGESRLQTNYQYAGFEVAFSDAEKELGKDKAMLFEEWGDFYIDGTHYENHVLIYSNESTFHGLFENPFDHGYKPFSLGAYLPTPGTLMGKSLGRDVVPLVHAYDAFLNSAIDIMNYAAGPIWTYLVSDQALKARFAEGKKVVVGPGDWLPVQSHDSLRPIQTDLQNLQVASMFMQRVKEEVRESTGGVSYATGGISGVDTDRTATEVNTLASGTSTRYQDLIQSYEDAKLKRFLWMWFENDRQFLSEPIEQDDDVITLDDIKQMDLTIEVIGSKTSMSQSRQSTALLGIMNMMPQLFQTQMFKPKADVTEVDLSGMLIQIGRDQGARNIEDYLDTVQTAEQGGGIEEALNELNQANQGGAPIDLRGVGSIAGMGAG